MRTTCSGSPPCDWEGLNPCRDRQARCCRPGDVCPESHVDQLPIVGKCGTVDNMTLIQTDARSRVVLPGHPEQMFAMQENSDGSILLLPAKITTEAQLEYDQTPELRDLLARAAASGTVRKRRRRAE